MCRSGLWRITLLLLLGHEEGGKQNAGFKQQPHGDRQQGLRDHVRWCQQHANDKGANNHIGALLTQTVRGGGPHPAEKNGGNRHLEGDTEGEEELQYKIEVVLHVWHHLDPFRCGRGEECKDQREDHIVGEGHADIEEHGAGGGQRQYQAALMFVEAGCDKAPDLIENVGDGQIEGEDQCQLEGGEEGRDHPGCHHALPFWQQLHQWAGDVVVDVVGEAKQCQKKDEDGEYDP